MPQKAYLRPLRMTPVKFACSFREKLWKYKCELEVILAYGFAAKWAKLQLPQKAHLGPQKITLVLYG